MEQWNLARAGPTTCPLCRKFWKQKSEDLITLDKELDTYAVQLYLDWLYTKRLLFPEDVVHQDEDFIIFLLKAWTVSDAIDDANFRYALIAEYISLVENEEYTPIWIDSIEYAFSDQSSANMKAFVTDAFLADIDPDWFDESSEDFPTAFTHALCRLILKSMQNNPTSQDLLKNHTDGEYEIKESVHNEDDYGEDHEDAYEDDDDEDDEVSEEG